MAGGGHGLDRSYSGWGQVAGTCKHVKEPWDSIKFGTFLDRLLKKDSATWSK